MTEKKCPMCDGNCLLKVIATEDSRFREVDVCSMCGAMYPRDKERGDGDEEKHEEKG